ncbi:peptidylprolyl isomerase [Candidatus Vallotiella sp. (ex Adelges kitamiensis)]|uniref:peptidylprolyl isomerase n=1 Tax=Candidatus Vallotiella sp. (ex Adelges kitamiensis) TaxID=2864217 RepID=UPI001CE25A27|nr:peptidylprolyl isomerase [Candidatus Vallotia sp. (ex Adelges kitamiensis)]
MIRPIRSALFQCTFLLINSVYAQALPSHQISQKIDHIVAVVNNDVITSHELDLQMELITRRLKNQNAPLPAPHQMRLRVLNQMVLGYIQLQQARDNGIVVDNATLQNTLIQLAQVNNMSLAQYRAQLESKGITWSAFSTDVRNELMLSKLHNQEVNSRIIVSDAEVHDYIASQNGMMGRIQQDQDLCFEHILIKVRPDASPTEIRAAQEKALDLLKYALSNKDFEQLAKANSQAPDALQGGNLGFRPVSSLPKVMTQAAFQLRPGQVNPEVLRTAEGFEIVRLIDRRMSSNTHIDMPKLVQTHARHILIRVNEKQSELSVQQKLLKLRSQIEAGGDFANFARIYSQDSSASQGGDLGWINPGETVPEFEQAMNNLEDNKISQPIHSNYGYHLVQVIERRVAQGFISKQEEIVYQIIGQRKAEQVYTDWLLRLCDSSYVRYNLDEPT